MGLSLDMDLGDLTRTLFSKKEKSLPGREEEPLASVSAATPYKKPLLIGAAMLVFFAAFMAGVYSPYTASIIGKKTTLEEKQDKQTQLARLNTEADALERDLVATKEYYAELLEHFGDFEDIGNLYESVSDLAVVNDLVVLNVQEMGKRHTEQVRNDVTIHESEVEVELKGKYTDYMNFKKALSESKAMINVFSEKIKVSQEVVDAGKVTVQLKLAVYTIDKEPFRRLLTSIKGKESEFASNE